MGALWNSKRVTILERCVSIVNVLEDKYWFCACFSIPPTLPPNTLNMCLLTRGYWTKNAFEHLLYSNLYWIQRYSDSSSLIFTTIHPLFQNSQSFISTHTRQWQSLKYQLEGIEPHQGGILNIVCFTFLFYRVLHVLKTPWTFLLLCDCWPGYPKILCFLIPHIKCFSQNVAYSSVQVSRISCYWPLWHGFWYVLSEI